MLGRSSGTSLRASGFLLCLSSPVLHKMLCGGFNESAKRRVEIEDVDGDAYSRVLDVWCGKEGLEAKGLEEALLLASLADRLEMPEAGAALEDAISEQLSVGMCGEVLMRSRRLGLRRVEAAARGLALERFEEVAGTAGFLSLDEEAVGDLLEDDGLRASREEAAFEGLVRWMKGGDGGLRGRGLLSKIRFGLMGREYLASHIRGTLGEEHAGWIGDFVLEALRLRAGGEGRGMLGAKGMAPRNDWGVRWERYGDGGGRRLQGHAYGVRALAECEGWVCSGSEDGSIRVWSRASLRQERTLHDEADTVDSLATWNGLLISGHSRGRIMAWDVATGGRVVELQDHSDMHSVRALAVSGSRLASGSMGSRVRVRAMGAGAEWPCERTLVGHGNLVQALATWRGKVAIGTEDDGVWVGDMGTGAHDATLPGHVGGVEGLVVHGDRLLSASPDGKVREWAAGTWAALRTVEVYGEEESRYPVCLAVSGSKLVCGSGGTEDDDAEPDVRVLDLETLSHERTLVQPAGQAVSCLVALRGEVWGGVGGEVVVWGRD